MIENSIKELRKQKKLTQDELASACDVSRQTIISIEKGNYTPSLLLAFKLSEVFGVPVESIFSISK